MGVGLTVAEGLGVAVVVGFGVAVGETVGFGVGVTTGTVPVNPNPVKTPSGVFSKEAS